MNPADRTVDKNHTKKATMGLFIKNAHSFKWRTTQPKMEKDVKYV